MPGKKINIFGVDDLSDLIEGTTEQLMNLSNDVNAMNGEIKQDRTIQEPDDIRAAMRTAATDQENSESATEYLKSKGIKDAVNASKKYIVRKGIEGVVNKLAD